jgi:phage-related protein
MNSGLKKIPAAFYRTPAGAEPVRGGLKRLSREERGNIGEDIADIEYSWPIGMPLCRSLGGGLWEVRSSLPSNRIARVIFCVEGGHMVLLHGFVKKTPRTPENDLALAGKRMREIRR